MQPNHQRVHSGEGAHFCAAGRDAPSATPYEAPYEVKYAPGSPSRHRWLPVIRRIALVTGLVADLVVFLVLVLLEVSLLGVVAFMGAIIAAIAHT
jgi:hypothetical protein